jgi:hypothetical protein
MARGTARSCNKGKEPARQLSTGQSTTSCSKTLERDNSRDVTLSTQTQRFEELDKELDNNPPLKEYIKDKLASNLLGQPLDPVNS